jgi:hypothetical protein
MNRPTGDQMKAYDAFDLIKFAWDKKWHLIIASTFSLCLKYYHILTTAGKI